MAKVLALRTDRLGDIVLVSGYLSALAASHEVDLWVSPGFQPVADILDPRLRVCETPFQSHLANDPSIITQWLETVRNTAYDIVVFSQFTHDYANLLTLGWVQTPERWGFANAEKEGHFGWLQNKLGDPINEPTPASFTSAATVDPFSPDIEKYAALAAVGGLPERALAVRPRLFIRGEVIHPVTDGRGTLVWPGSGIKSKQWPVERFAELLRLAGDRYPEPIEVGGSEAERELVERCCDAITAYGRDASAWIIDVANLADTTRTLQKFARVLSNDTGIAHIAAAVGTPVDAVSPSEYQGRFVLQGTAVHNVFADILCRQCRGACIFPDQAIWPCVSAIHAPEVAAALTAADPPSVVFLRTGDRFSPTSLFEAQRSIMRQNDQMWSEALARFDRESRKFRSIFVEAETQRDSALAVLRDSERHRDELCELLSDAEAQRDEWRMHHDALEERLRQARAEAEDWRSQLETIKVLTEPFVRDRAAPPFISIVTPSFRHAPFIRETIESVSSQGYEPFEHLVVDGGSTDATLGILKEYPHLKWVSERDRGQAHAINKGLLAARGEIIAYINSDDFYLPGAFDHVAELFSNNPNVGLIVGACERVDESSRRTGLYSPRYERFEDLVRYWGWDRWVCIPQPSTFWRRSVLAEVGLFDVDCQMALDYDMWLRMVQVTEVKTTERSLAAFRIAPETKTVSRTDEMYLEEFDVSRRYWHRLPLGRRLRIAAEARHHLGNQLLGVAEHYALNPSGNPSPACRLTCEAFVRAPWIALNPRLLLTALSSLRIPGKGQRWPTSHRLHRAYLTLCWHLRKWTESARQDEEP